jgi:beta-phosphoglucomutase-like phosphatase (HAD superfamily)
MGLHVHPDARALIFDLDGTLSNSLPVHMATWNKVGEDLRIQIRSTDYGENDRTSYY